MKGEVLATYPSKSDPNKEYEIIRGHDGVTYCTCWQWKLNRTCSHLENYLSGNKTYSVRKVINAKGKIDTYLDLAKAIEQAVKELTQGVNMKFKPGDRVKWKKHQPSWKTLEPGTRGYVYYGKDNKYVYIHWIDKGKGYSDGGWFDKDFEYDNCVVRCPLLNPHYDFLNLAIKTAIKELS